MISDSIENSRVGARSRTREEQAQVHRRRPSPQRRLAGAKKPASKPKADRANKKAEVIALMKRAKGATLAEIMKATGWQAHTVRGFVSILGSKGGEKIESSKSADGERTYKIQVAQRNPLQSNAASGSGRGGVPACVGHIAHPVT